MITNYDFRHFLQSDAWMKFQESQNKKIIKGSGNDWSVSALLETSSSRLGGNTKRIYAPYGPHVKSYRGLKEALQFLSDTAKQERAIYVRIEPIFHFSSEQMQKLGCKKASRDYQPALTNIVDLSQDTDSLLLAMNSGVRRLSRQYEQRGFEFFQSYSPDDMDEFLKMMEITADRSGVIFRDSAYLKSMVAILGPEKNAGIAYLKHNNKPISGVLFCDDVEGGTRYYLHAGSFDEARKLSANPALGLFLLLQAKENGFKKFDFCGVSPIEDSDHKWAGFSAFKRSFGGEDVAYTGTWELPVNKPYYHSMRFARLLKEKLNFPR